MVRNAIIRNAEEERYTHLESKRREKVLPTAEREYALLQRLAELVHLRHLARLDPPRARDLCSAHVRTSAPLHSDLLLGF